MGDLGISAAPAGQPGTVLGTEGGQQVTAGGQQTAPEQNQPQVNYVTPEQLNAAIDGLKRTFQSATDKSYNRVEKMIQNMQQAGIQNPTEQQARAMLAMQDQGSEQQEPKANAQEAKTSAANPAAEAWIRENGGDPALDYWMDIYDAAQEAGVGIITKDDPELEQFFMENGQPKSFSKPRHFVRAFEQAFEAKKQRLSTQPGAAAGSLASSPGLASGGQKSNFYDPKTTDRYDLISQGLREKRRR